MTKQTIKDSTVKSSSTDGMYRTDHTTRVHPDDIEKSIPHDQQRRIDSTDPAWRVLFGAKPDGRLKWLKNGEVSYRNPDIIKFDGVGSHPFKMVNPSPRMESMERYLSRVQKDIEKTAGLLNIQENAGKVCQGRDGKLWRIVATDGHRMLLVRAAEGSVVNQVCFTEGAWDKDKTESAVLNNAEFHCALKRAEIMCDERSRLVKLTFNGRDRLLADSVVVESSRNDVGTFDEPVTIKRCPGTRDTEVLTVGLNVDYLDVVLGVWPLRVWWTDTESMLVFGDDGDSFRYAVMPMRMKTD